MIILEDQYYDINQRLLIIAGLWPYQKWRFRIIPIIFFLTVLISYLIVQLATFVTSSFNINLVLTVFSQVLPCLIYILKYSSFLLNSRLVKECYERLRRDWITLKVPDEIDILRKYADITKLFTIIIIVLASLAIISFSLFQFLPNILDVALPLNESRKHHFVFKAEYFIDQERYFYFILIHSLLATSMGGIGVISTGCMLAGYALHTCAMLKIASYRLEHITDKIPPGFNFKRDHIIRERIIAAVNIHRRALEFAEFMLSRFMLIYFILIGVGVLSLTINMFQLLHLAMLNDMNGTLGSIFFVISHFLYLFLANFLGQLITDHNTDVFNTTYTTQWYTVSVQAQKLLLLIMQRNTKNYYFVIGGVYVASLEGFATLASTSISYFTVIYSTQ
ncbi:uncharacterized protein [Anoplolepis gracilipes]|uniref:uncharacterized protein n=1 Tax=Anoplolepis gracilipes TaxID=354296 RepID=UPI003BA32691